MKAPANRRGPTATTLALESLASLRAHGLMTVARVLVALGLGFAVAFLSSAEVGSLEDRYSDQLAAGRFAWLVDSAGAISARDCAALSASAGVVAAGGELSSQEIRVSTRPAASYPLRRVTAGYVTAVWPNLQALPSGGILVGSTAAEALGLHPGSEVTVTTGIGAGGTDRIAMVLDPSLRQPDADRSFLLLAAPAGQMRTCLVDAAPGSSSTVGRLLRGWFGKDVSVSPLLISEGGTSQPERDLGRRSTELLWLAASALLVLASAFHWRMKRADYALYRVLGFTRRGLVVLSLVEAGVAVVAPYAAGMLLGLLMAAPSGSVTISTVLYDCARALLFCSFVPVVDLLVRGRGDVASQLKGR